MPFWGLQSLVVSSFSLLVLSLSLGQGFRLWEVGNGLEGVVGDNRWDYDLPISNGDGFGPLPAKSFSLVSITNGLVEK